MRQVSALRLHLGRDDNREVRANSPAALISRSMGCNERLSHSTRSSPMDHIVKLCDKGDWRNSLYFVIARLDRAIHETALPRIPTPRIA